MKMISLTWGELAEFRKIHLIVSYVANGEQVIVCYLENSTKFSCRS